MDNIYTNGEAVDARTLDQKKKDFPDEEFLGAGVTKINWIEKPISEWIKIGRREQVSSSSCGGQAGAKGLSYIVKDTVSAILYRFRKNYPSPGMWIQDIGDILVKIGSGLESLNPSQYIDEETFNNLKAEIVGLKYKIGSYYFIPGMDNFDPDRVASALDSGHPVVILTRFKNSEWTSVPKTNDSNDAFYGHFVTVVPGNYTLYNGEKAFIVDDSTGFYSAINDSGQRVLTESWLKQRSFGIMALVPVKVEEKNKPLHTFNTNLVYGNRGPEVKALQECLIYEGLMKEGLNTGYFGPLTLKAVIEFQKKYKKEILVPAKAENATGKVLTYTRKQLNKLYSN